MRIAFFADSYKPYISGVTTSIETLANELRLLGHRVYIVAPSYPGQDNSDPDIIRMPSIKTWYPGFRLSVPYLRDFPDVDIIHTHSPFQMGLLAEHMAHKKNIPLVYTFHTLFTRYTHYIKFIPEIVSKITIKEYIKNFCGKAGLIITPSKMSQKVLDRWGIKTSHETVPTGIKLSCFQSSEEAKKDARKFLGIPENAKLLLYVGRISKEKNIPFLIEAFKKINRDNLFFVLIGGGPLIKELKQQNIKNIVFAGEVGHEKLPSLYCAGDIFVFASKTETQGLVLAEAKAAGLPIVALFAGGLVDTVRNDIDGYLTARSPDDFIRHTIKLLEDDNLRSKMGTLAHEDAIERFSSNLVAKRMENLYNLLVAKKEKKNA